MSSEEMARRRVEGLCFNCSEKFTPGHLKHCTMKGIYLMELDDDLVQVDDDESDEEPKISMHALTGIHTSDTMHLVTKIADRSLRALVDSGSTHSFIATSAASRLGLVYEPRTGLSWASRTAIAFLAPASVARYPSPSAKNGSTSTSTSSPSTTTTSFSTAPG